MMKFVNFMLLFALMGVNTLFATAFKVDKENSEVAFSIRHAVVAKVHGEFKDFSGTYDYDDTLKHFNSFKGDVQIASIDTKDIYRDNHLKLKVFDVDIYPSMDIKLIKQDGSDFLAMLTIKGISKEVNFNIAFSPEEESIFILTGKISRKDFNLKFSDTAEVGGIAVGDEIKINIHFKGIKID